MATTPCTFSQFGQDLYLINNICKHKKEGYFIELGACDGIEFSNTLLLEKNYGWKGICIEPNPIYEESLKKNRKCHVCYDLVYSSSGKEMSFTMADLLSGITSDINKHKFILANKAIQLKTTTLTEVLDRYEAPSYIDYLSLDTEGSELEILKGLDFKKYRIGYMCIEHNFVEPQRTDVRNFLAARGYIFQRENYVDDEYRFAIAHIDM